jgi:hypothetical protein
LSRGSFISSVSILLGCSSINVRHSDPYNSIDMTATDLCISTCRGTRPNLTIPSCYLSLNYLLSMMTSKNICTHFLFPHTYSHLNITIVLIPKHKNEHCDKRP